MTAMMRSSTQMRASAAAGRTQLSRPQILLSRQASRRGNRPAMCQAQEGDKPQRRQQAEPIPTRREVLQASAMVGSTVLLSAAPAQAFLGIGEDDGQKIQEVYLSSTKSVLENVQKVLDTPKDDPTKEDQVKELRKQINSWVASYRREGKVAGRPSFSVTYSILNALAGHFNSFGPTAPIPKKRLERIDKEMKDAALYLSRNR